MAMEHTMSSGSQTSREAQQLSLAAHLQSKQNTQERFLTKIKEAQATAQITQSGFPHMPNPAKRTVCVEGKNLKAIVTTEIYE